MGLRTEKYFPFCIALVVGAAWWHFAVFLPSDEKEFLAAALSMGAVLTGFIATAQAILMALPSDSVMAQMRTSGYLPILIRYIGSALGGGMFFCITNLSGFFLLQKDPVRLPLWFSVLWIVSAIYALLTFYRVTKVMMKIMRH